MVVKTHWLAAWSGGGVYRLFWSFGVGGGAGMRQVGEALSQGPHGSRARRALPVAVGVQKDAGAGLYPYQLMAQALPGLPILLTCVWCAWGGVLLLQLLRLLLLLLR